MHITRRAFIASTVAAALLPLPSLALPSRSPFVEVGDDVSFLYFEDWSRPMQPTTISAFVEHVGEWDGRAYPIVLSRHYLGSGFEFWDAIDAEWSMFRKEIPDFHWRNVRCDRYPNIHSFVREKRFGEDPRAVSAQMRHNRLHGTPFNGGEGRGTVTVRKTKFAA